MSDQPSADPHFWRVALARFVVCALLTGCGEKPHAREPAELARTSSLVACDSGERLPLGVAVFSSTALGSARWRSSCVHADAPQCVFRLSVSERSDVHLALESVSFDGALALFYLSAKGTELACVDDTPIGDTHHARIDATLAAGEYAVVVAGASGEAGVFELFAQLDPLPSVRASCSAAEVLAPGRYERGSTRGAPNLFSATCAGGAQGPDRVYTLRVDEPSRVRARQQGDYDGALYLRARCEDPSSEIACNDDFRDALHSALTAELAPGSYSLFTDSYSRGQSGDYVLSLETVPVPVPRSLAQVCGDALERPLGPGAHEVDTFTARSLTSGSCGGEGAPERIIAFDVPRPSLFVAELEDPELNAVLYVRRTCSDRSAEEACFVAPRIDRPRGVADSGPVSLVTSLSAGRYVLVVDGVEAGEMGAARVRYALEALPSAVER